MPEWKDFGYLFIKGLSAFVVRIIYMIPAIVVIMVGIGVALGDIASTMLGTVITPEIMSQIKAGEATPQEIGQIFGEKWYLFLPTVLKAAPILIFGFILALIAAFLTPIAVLNYMNKKRFSAAFELGTIIKKALTGKYIISWLLVLILGAVLGTVLVFIPIIGPAIVLFIMGVIGYSLYGEVYREA
jgi:hypothetical protein